jgi:hypothetical protein
MQHPFLEVDGRRMDPAFREEVARALNHLRRGGTDVGLATFDLIVSGKVKVDTLSDITREDFRRLRRELRPDGVELDESMYERLHEGRGMRAITSTIDGYAWDDRIYVSPGMDPKALAATLVHEVNHILNASEEHYRSPKSIFVEEYRAHLAEALLRGEELNPTRCRRIKEHVISSYGLRGVTAADVPDVPPGRMLPDGWRRGGL